MNINPFHHHYAPLLEQITKTNWDFGDPILEQGPKREAKVFENNVTAVGTPETDGGRHTTRFCSRGHWKPHEDAQLKELVALHGPQNWNLIAQNLQGRSGKSCRLRWFNQLDPRLNRRAFTEEEEERLMEAQKMYGNKWATIARLFPGRTDNAVKNHWHVLVARNHRRQRPQQQINTDSSTRKTSASSGCKRRKKTNRIKNLGTSSNAVDATTESTVDSKSNVYVDETASTCTHLSLSASFDHNPTPDLQILLIVTGSSSSRVEEGKSRSGVNTSAMDAWGGQSQSSNSEVSASESVADLKSTNQISDQGNQSNKMAFFDFLGVGAT